jgi:hypothetical protein
MFSHFTTPAFLGLIPSRLHTVTLAHETVNMPKGLYIPAYRAQAPENKRAGHPACPLNS